MARPSRRRETVRSWRSAGFVVVLVAALALLSWFLGSGPPHHLLVAAASKRLADGALEQALDHERVAGDVVRVETTRGPGELPAGSGMPGALPGPVDGLEVRVIDDRTGDGLANAVVVIEGRRQEPHRFGEWIGRDELLAHASGSCLADERGVAHVPWPESGAVEFLHVLDGERAGKVRVGSFTPPPVELRVRDPQTHDVLVVDSRGAPAADVAVVFGEGYSGSRIEAVGPIVRTDAEGRAALPGLEQREREEWREFVVVAPQLLGKLVTAVVDPDAPPPGPTRLALPPFGVMTFRVVDERGARLERDGWLAAFPVDPRGYAETSCGIPVEVRDGVAHGLLVPIGAQVQVAWWDAWGTEVTRFDGPRDAGEEVVVDFVTRRAPARLAARALDPSGRPLANTSLRCRSSTWCESVVADGQGRFTLDAAGILHTGERFDVEITQTDPGFAWSRSATLPLPDRLDQDADLGDVTLVELPLFVSGRLVDDCGAPMGGVWLEVFQYEDGRYYGFEIDPLDRRTRDDGGFTWFAPQDGIVRRIRAAGPGITARNEPEFTAGTRDLELVAARSGRIHGSLRFDGPIPEKTLSVELRDEQARQSWAGRVAEAEVRADGAFLLEGRPGGWTLVVKGAPVPHAEKREVLTIRDVRVEPGAIASEARLEEIDLRGIVESLRVTLRKSDGRPNQGFVRLLATGSDEELASRTTSASGRAEFLVPASSTVSVEAWAPGCRHVRREGASDELVVDLQDGGGATLELALADPRVIEYLASESVRRDLVVAVVPAGSPAELEIPWLVRELDREGKVRFELPEPGRWEVRARCGDRPTPDVAIDLGALVVEVVGSPHLERALPLTIEGIRAAEAAAQVVIGVRAR